MLRRVLLALCAFALAGVQAHAQLLPGRAPGFRPGFQFLASWAMPGAVYDADFANGLYTAGPPSISRASQGYAADAAGAYALFGNDTLRRTNVGATVEVADTNWIRDSAMQGAAAGSPGVIPNFWTLSLGSGLTRQIVSVSAVSGLDCMDTRVSGSSTSSGAWLAANFQFEVAGNIAASAGQTWTPSVFAQLVAGSLPANTQIELEELTAANANVRYANRNISVDGALRRFDITQTISGANTAFIRPGFWIYGPTTANVLLDFTIRLCWPHLSQAARVFSPIRTTNGAAARAADVVTLPVAGIGRVVVTFDDGSTQTFTGISTATPWTIPAANLNRSIIRRLTGYAL